MTRLAALIEYDGSRYSGWQRQVGACTVQQCVETALSQVGAHDIVVTVAGRTDSGVHAVGQVVHFDSRSQRAPHQWIRGANSNLPPSIRLQWVKEVDAEFNARFSATRRSYRYIILNDKSDTALFAERAVVVRAKLNDVAMQAAARALVGRHDFSAYRAAGCQANSPIREVVRLEINRFGKWIYIDIEANAFLHHMVRNVVGTLLPVGRGDQEPHWPKVVLDGRDRRRAGITAPAHGLYLVAVRYPSCYQIPEPPPPRFW